MPRFGTGATTRRRTAITGSVPPQWSRPKANCLLYSAHTISTLCPIRPHLPWFVFTDTQGLGAITIYSLEY